MRKKLALATTCLLACSMLASLTPKSSGWAYFNHGAMAEDTLRALGWAETEIANIPGYANQVDDPINGLPHPGSSNHRVEKYQRVFESYGGENCSFMGAEKWASGFVGLAEMAYTSGDIELGKKNLGYAIHYIQDALCPPHVFPYSEKLDDTASWNFEAYALSSYGIVGNNWQALVRNAPAELIASPEDLRQKVEEAADWVNATFQPSRCSYVRQDGVIIGDLSATLVGWNMSDDDIGRCMERAASLVKGAARWAYPNAKNGTIYIRADGSIDPPIAPISSVDNTTYIFTDSIYDEIVVERSNIVIEGANYTLQGYQSGYGFSLAQVGNVTIRNTNIRKFANGIYSDGSSNITISENSIEDNYYGMILKASNGTIVRENNIMANEHDGIFFQSNCFHNDVFGNNITQNEIGILLHGSSGNKIYENSITDNSNYGIHTLWPMTDPSPSNNNTFYKNDIKDNGDGIYLSFSSYNSLCQNNIVRSGQYGIYVEGFNHTISEDNIESNGGVGLCLWESSNVTVYGNNIEHSASQGIWLNKSPRNSIMRNNVTNNAHGIILHGSSDNVICKNNVMSNSGDGIFIDGSNNEIYHNNVINNTRQAYSSVGNNVWDDGYPSGGNFWSDRNSADLDYDGLCDTSYKIDVNNTDNYPLAGTFSEFSATSDHTVQTVSNSTVSDLEFNGTAIGFNVSGKNGTSGFCRLTIPHALLSPPYSVTVSNCPAAYTTIFENDTLSIIYIIYTLSTKKIVIVPEFESFLILLLFMIVTVPAADLYRRRRIHCRERIVPD